MVVKILIALMLLILGAGFVFFLVNVLWLGTREFFKIYGSKQDRLKEKSRRTKAKK